MVPQPSFLGSGNRGFAQKGRLWTPEFLGSVRPFIGQPVLPVARNSYDPLLINLPGQTLTLALFQCGADYRKSKAISRGPKSTGVSLRDFWLKASV